MSRQHALDKLWGAVCCCIWFAVQTKNLYPPGKVLACAAQKSAQWHGPGRSARVCRGQTCGRIVSAIVEGRDVRVILQALIPLQEEL